jgi:hypothetical protein
MFCVYDDVLFANTPKANPEQLKAYAQEVGLDVSAFEQYFSSGKYQTAMQEGYRGGHPRGHGRYSRRLHQWPAGLRRPAVGG